MAPLRSKQLSGDEVQRGFSPHRWWRRWWARGVQALLVFAILAAGMRYFEDWRGARALRLEKEAMRLRGEPLALSALRLPPVPPQENFMESSVMREMWHDMPLDESTRWAKLTSLDASLMRERLQNKRLKAEFLGYPNPENIGQWRDGLEKAEMLVFAATTGNPAEDIYQAWDAISGSLFQELYAAARQRPHSRLEFTDGELFGYGADSRAFGEKTIALQHLTRALNIRGRLALMTSRPEEAIQCLRVTRRMSEAYHSLPDYLGFIYYIFHLGNVVDLIDQAAKDQAFTSAQWQEVIYEIPPLDIHASYLRAQRGEAIALNARMQNLVENRQQAISEMLKVARSFRQHIAAILESTSDEAGISWIDHFIRAGMTLIPSGWYHQNNATLLRWREEYLLRPLRGHALPHFAAHLPAYERMVYAEMKRFRYHPEKWLAMQVAPTDWSFAKRALEAYVLVEMARTAAALEIFCQENGSYPNSLADLVPTHLPGLPIDLDGKPLRYRLSEKTGRPVIYSVGEDLTDNNGAVHERDLGTHRARYPKHRDGSDAVWSYDPPPEKKPRRSSLRSQ